MSYVIYYSNYCENSKNVIKKLNQYPGIHWLCIDKRVKENNSTYIILENGEKVLLPPSITRIPAMLSLKDYSIIYGNDILNSFSAALETQVKVATKNNMEPVAFSFSGNNGVVSDFFSSWNLPASELSAAEGNGGMDQMHHYVNVNYVDNVSQQFPSKESYEKKSRMNPDMTIEKLMEKRNNEIKWN